MRKEGKKKKQNGIKKKGRTENGVGQLWTMIAVYVTGHYGEQYKKWRKDGTIYRYILWRREMKGIDR